MKRQASISSEKHQMNSYATHPQRTDGTKLESETRFRYVFKNPFDHSREVILAVVTLAVPTCLPSGPIGQIELIPKICLTDW